MREYYYSQNGPRNHTNRKVWIIGVYLTLSMFFFNTFYLLGYESIGKIASGLLLWLCVLSFPFYYVHHNDFPRIVRFLLSFIFVYTIFQAVRSLVVDVPGATGNKFVSLFGNEYFMFTMLAPLFLYLGASVKSLYYIKKAFSLYIIGGAIFVLFGKPSVQYIIYYLFVLLPFISKKDYFFIGVGVVTCVYSSFFVEDTQRTIAIFLVFTVVYFIFTKIVKSIAVIRFVCYSLIIIPLVYAIMSVVIPDFSVFKIVLSSLLEQTADVDLANDTRTFLFKEISDDLTQNNGWIIGKGAYSFYFSEYFLNSTSGNGDHFYRVIPEVTFLAFLLRGGIIYVTCFYTLLLCAVRNALKYTNNSFLISLAFMASLWSFVSCFSNLSGCDFHHYIVYSLIGCCCSKRWQKLSDIEIKGVIMNGR